MMTHLYKINRTQQESQSMKCFLIEDAPIIRERVILILESIDDLTVEAYAETEQEALNWLLNNQWDLVIVDLNLKKGSGLKVLDEIKDKSKYPGKRVVLTNYTQDNVRKVCLKLGADKFFDKSNEFTEFLHYLEDIAHKH